MRQSEIIRKATEFGSSHGFVTFDQFNELVPATTAAPKDIEAVTVIEES